MVDACWPNYMDASGNFQLSLGTKYSDPSRPIELPFPSTNTVPSRFAISGNGSFLFLGREKFADVWDMWLRVSADIRHRRAIYIYGTGGYGRSHILAALACLLVRNHQRVVYIPDCRAMLSRPLVYLRNAFLFAFADPQSEYRKGIWECQHVEALGDFCEKYEYEGGRLCFIMDQLNALDPEPKGQDNVTDKQKSAIGSLLQRMAAGHVEITSASANHKTAKHMERKDTGEQKIALLGGMTKAEMSHWWSRNAKDFAAFGDDDKLRVEDLTGCIPLLLEPFLGNSGMNLDALEPRIWNKDVLDLLYHFDRPFSHASRATVN
ncbi:hypothetical protein PILCRDRAFT_484362 [Piloderma croceum F 1598]|uniref:Chromosomal replication initiator protein DnaA domain-containing protein n=1 Tax=Piloderma croceum (strain F 1598) TaxID=765440 RepID=A0A0C3B751_PILCF|nr:hypothetical protein PILCRDRAFT_484362 [Piloderma croceum F 1598]